MIELLPRATYEPLPHATYEQAGGVFASAAFGQGVAAISQLQNTDAVHLPHHSLLPELTVAGVSHAAKNATTQSSSAVGVSLFALVLGLAAKCPYKWP